MSDDNKSALHAAIGRRRRAALLWKLFMCCCFLLLLEIPLPPLAPHYAFPLSMIFLVLTGHSFYMARRLPVREALLLAKVLDGRLTKSTLCTELELDPPTAEVLLHTMKKQGFIQVDDGALLGEGEVIYRVKGLLPSGNA